MYCTLYFKVRLRQNSVSAIRDGHIFEVALYIAYAVCAIIRLTTKGISVPAQTRGRV
jgi:hypothetical protein